MKKSFIFLLICLFGLFNLWAQGPESEAHANLHATDVAFSDYSIKHGMNQALIEFSLPDAVLLRPASAPIIGLQAIEKHLMNKIDTAYTISWEPLQAIVAQSGELGYTYGLYTLRMHDSGKLHRGTYVSIWQKNADGLWRLALDSGNDGLKPHKH